MPTNALESFEFWTNEDLAAVLVLAALTVGALTCCYRRRRWHARNDNLLLEAKTARRRQVEERPRNRRATSGGANIQMTQFRHAADLVLLDEGMLQTEADREAAALLARLQAKANEVDAEIGAAHVASLPPPPPPQQQEEERTPAPAAKNEGGLSRGEVCMYEHRRHGWILVEIVSADHEGAHDGGVTYVIKAPEIDGIIETERSRLMTSAEYHNQLR